MAVRVNTKDGPWGILPGHQTPICVDKIADSVDKIVEIVRAYINPAQNAVSRAVRPEAQEAG